MVIKQAQDIYNDMLNQFTDSLKKVSEDTNEQFDDKYMTMCEQAVVNFDKFKNEFIREMGLDTPPKSCDALYMTRQNEFYMIEFKNGIIEALKNYEIKVKIYESLLILCEKFSGTIEFMRDNLSFILVYNENVTHGQYQYNNIGQTSLEKIKKSLFDFAGERYIRFGLHHFKKLYFKEVYTYSKAEFDSEFVSKYCA
jgi:hypothetical protein